MLLTIPSTNQSLAEYWQAGVDNMLADHPEEAQAAILLPFLSIDSVLTEELMQASLLEFLTGSATAQESLGASNNAQKILRLGQAIFPEDINNLLRLVRVSLGTAAVETQALALLPQILRTTNQHIDQSLMQAVLLQTLKHSSRELLSLFPENFLPDLVTAFLEKSQDKKQSIQVLFQGSFHLSHQHCQDLRTQVLEVCLQFCDTTQRFPLLNQASIAAAMDHQYAKSIELAELCCVESQGLNQEHQLIANYQLLHSLMEAGDWQKIPGVAAQHFINTQALINVHPDHLEQPGIAITSAYYLSYLYDHPQQLQEIRSHLGRLCTTTIQSKIALPALPAARQHKRLRLGYIGSTLSSHSVGWLSRWILKYHDRHNLQIFIYNIGREVPDPFNQKYFCSEQDTCYYFGTNTTEIVQRIRQDQIDILVDLDSLTFSATCEVMACRAAPIQITWLGWDTSGCPEIDYFIADPHVLPADAEDYYATKIWRLPQTYIAIDGFEVGIPSRRRAELAIPKEAIVYLCGQKSYKHHPDILRLQMQILQEVPHSYLLVKLRGDRTSLINSFQACAQNAGISPDRLRFLDSDADEYVHRANLSIADVVLDTFPYNGATTTLETIWAGVPIVTKVGQSFMARNSYAFLQNVGIDEGIAHSDPEYVAWGVQFGLNLTLRQQVSGKMLQSRKTSPLWNTRAFTLAMENAYQQMWQIHQQQTV